MTLLYFRLRRSAATLGKRGEDVEPRNYLHAGPPYPQPSERPGEAVTLLYFAYAAGDAR